jgi:uncharacterized protein
LNEKLRAYLSAAPDLYPHELEARFPHVVQRIVEAWPSPELALALFEDLLVDKRGGRQGFPPGIAREIFRLSVAYDEQREKPVERGDVWGEENPRAEQAFDELGAKDLASDMLRAAEGADTSKLLLFLKAGMAADTRDERGWTPLMAASFQGNEAAAKMLIENGADPQARDRSGYVALHWAALKGALPVVELLAPRVDCNAKSQSGLTPLLQAAAEGHAPAVRMLVAAGADANLASNEGWTPLHKAVANGHPDVVQILLAAGASVLAKHVSGATPMSIALKSGREDILRILRGADAPRA